MFGINIYVVYMLFQMNLLTYAKLLVILKYIFTYIVIVIVIFYLVESFHPIPKLR